MGCPPPRAHQSSSSRWASEFAAANHRASHRVPATGVSGVRPHRGRRLRRLPRAPGVDGSASSRNTTSFSRCSAWGRRTAGTGVSLQISKRRGFDQTTRWRDVEEDVDGDVVALGGQGVVVRLEGVQERGLILERLPGDGIADSGDDGVGSASCFRWWRQMGRTSFGSERDAVVGVCEVCGDDLGARRSPRGLGTRRQYPARPATDVLTRSALAPSGRALRRTARSHRLVEVGRRRRLHPRPAEPDA